MPPAEYPRDRHASSCPTSEGLGTYLRRPIFCTDRPVLKSTNALVVCVACAQEAGVQPIAPPRRGGARSTERFLARGIGSGVSSPSTHCAVAGVARSTKYGTSDLSPHARDQLEVMMPISRAGLLGWTNGPPLRV